MKRNHIVVALQALVTAVLVFAALPAQPAHAAVTSYYVDPGHGSDSNPGTSTAAAFKTIQRAQAQVRAVNSTMSDDIVVHLRGGTYSLTSPIDFTTADSGGNGHSVTYQAYGTETPVVTSGRTITGWTPAGNGQYKASVGALNFRQMYVNGVRGTRARYPDVGSNFQLQASDKASQVLKVLGTQVAGWSNFTQVEMVLQLQWAENFLRLKSFTNAGGMANLSIQDHEAGILFQRPFPLLSNGSPLHFENAREFVTEPGEFYVDTAAQTVYYLPRDGENMATATVQAPTLETLFRVKGTSLDNPVHNLKFSGITFTRTTWLEASRNGLLNGQGGHFNLSADTGNHQYVDRPPAGVYVALADAVSFTGNTFTQMGATALDLHHGVHGGTVTGNVVHDIAGNGIMVGKFSDPGVEYHTVYNPPSSPAGEDVREVVSGTTVTDNLINRVAQDYLGTAGINAGFVKSTTINHNDISDGAWAGITLGWGWQAAANASGNNTVSHNRIGNVVNQLCDTGGIYHLSNSPGTVFEGNYIHDNERTPTACGSAVAGIYLDEGSGNMTVRNNVLSNTDNFVVQNANGPNVTLTGNATTGTATMAASGLEPAYQGLSAKIDLAYGKPTSASSNYSAGFASAKANDNNASTGWSPTGSDTSAWWQVDLGAPYALSQFSLTTRQDLDQPQTRSGFEVRGSNDPSFAGYTVLGRQDSATLPYGATLTGKIDVRQKFRYVRVAKTDGAYFYLTELGVQQAGGALAGSVATPNFTPSTYYTIKNVNSGLLADVYDNSTSDGADVVQWTGNNGLNQQWTIVKVSGNLYRIVNRNSGKALEVANGSHAKGTKLVQRTYTGGNNQLWSFEPASGGYVIRNFETRQAVEVYGAATTDGAVLDQWAALNQPNQLWTIQ
jgi:hypothetical protein